MRLFQIDGSVNILTANLELSSGDVSNRRGCCHEHPLVFNLKHNLRGNMAHPCFLLKPYPRENKIVDGDFYIVVIETINVK